MPRWIWLLLAVLVGLLWWTGRGTATSMPAAVSGIPLQCPLPPAPADVSEPLQSDVGGRILPFRLDNATVSPLAGFSLQARILSREDYSTGRESHYSPTDLALGWGPMATPGIAEKLDIRQGGRWYRYRWGNEGPPLPPAQIARNSANMHMVPASAEVARALSRLSKGDMVRVQGWLVRIDGDDGGHWQSSLSRDDQGAGACELILVCAIDKR